MHSQKNSFSLRNLSIQFSLIVIGLPTLVLMGFGLYQIKTQTIAFENSLANKLKNEAAQLSASLSTALFNFDDETCKVICEAALEKPEIIKITIRDLTEIYQRFAVDDFSKIDLNREGKIVQVPILFKTEHIGDLEIIATTRLLKQRIGGLKRSILWQILILDVILGFAMALVLLIRFVGPLKELQMGSEKIASGDLDYPIDVRRKDELGALAVNLLTMRDAVKEKVTSLESEIVRHEQTSVSLKKTKGYITNILNSMPSMLISLDTDLIITQWNIRAEELTGISGAEAVGNPVFEAVPHLEALKENILSTITSKEIYFRPRHPRSLKSGKMVYEDITVYPLISELLEGVVIRVDNVTDHVKMEQMVVQSEKMMSVGGLAAGMAHEINNPLAGMMQNAQVVLRRIQEDIPASVAAAKEAGIELEAIRMFMDKRGITRQLESIHLAGVRASQIVQNMLSFSRKDYSGKSLHNVSEILDLSLELARSDYDLKKQYDFKTFEVIRDYESDLPQVSCEASKIQQVFFNILKNCAQAMEDRDSRESQEQPRLYLKVSHQNPDVVVEIEDNGPGMDEAVRKRIFEPFFTTKPVGTGTGLGLSVSYFIITDNHRGKMNVISTPGRGTRFFIHLPKA